jgi:hypothetical protein
MCLAVVSLCLWQETSSKMKAKVLPDELLVITDCAADPTKFVIMTELDPHKTVTTRS